jgi:uncharacterized SAM-binding protein YcdF (DUF218 family)
MFIALLLLASFYAKKFRLFFLCGTLFFYALSNSYVADALLSPLEHPYNTPLHVSPNANAVVVLGGGHIKGSANLPLTDEAYKRSMWGIIIAKTHQLPLLFSGAGADSSYTESDAFLDSIKELNVLFNSEIPMNQPLHDKNFSLHVENKSLDTYQNAKLSKEAFEKAGILNPTVYLVTSAYHMKRSSALYEHFGFKIIPAATAFKISTREKNGWDYLPNIWALEKSYTALHEYAGLLSLKLRGI